MAKQVVRESVQSGNSKYEVEAVPGEYVIVRRWDVKNDGLAHFMGESRFEVGDFAEYDSYNLSYYGPVKSISAKGVVVNEQYASNGKVRSHRLKWENFVWRNWCFNAEQAQASNSNVMQYI